MRFAIVAAASTLAAIPGVAASAKAALDTARIEQLTGAKGQLDERDGVFKVSVPRTDLQPTVAGVKIPPSMGLTSWAAFQGAPGHAMVMGDLVLAEDQVNPVMSVALDSGLEVTALHKLRGAGIDIVAIHQHMTGEQPRVLFLHYWGVGPAQNLARGLRAALDRTATRLGAR